MSEKLSRKDIRSVFARNHGAASELARNLSVSPVAVSQVLRGRVTSERIMLAAEERALLLLLDEEERSCVKA